MALTSEQRRVLATIQRVARQRGASPKEIKAAVETGLVESNLRNLSGGDADSAGWRQERASIYKDPQNLSASVNRFFNETSAVKHKYGSAGDLAAAVQRPAAQYRGRYQQRSGDAEALLRGFSGSKGVKGSRTVPGTPGTPATSSSRQVPDELARRQAVAQYLLNRGQPGALLQALQARQAATRTETTVTPGTPGTPARTARTRPQKPSAGKPNGASKLKIEELFYDPGINLDNGGQRVGAIGGHGDHVHVSYGSEQSRAAGVKLAKKLGLVVTSEGGGKHATGSFHYRKFKDGTSQGVDFGGSSAAMARFNKAIAARARK